MFINTDAEAVIFMWCVIPHWFNKSMHEFLGTEWNNFLRRNRKKCELCVGTEYYSKKLTSFPHAIIIAPQLLQWYCNTKPLKYPFEDSYHTMTVSYLILFLERVPNLVLCISNFTKESLIRFMRACIIQIANKIR